MKDLPIFTTENGVASLTLKEVPYTQRAYVRIQNSRNPQKLLQECIDFCRAVGAEEIFAADERCKIDFPHYTDILEMIHVRSELPDTTAVAHVVKEPQLFEFRSIYNAKMRSVPNAAHLSINSSEDMLKKQCAYMVMQEGKRIGIGVAADETIEMIAALEKGKGQDVLAALSKQLQSENVRVVVASKNVSAVSLYERLGFRVANLLARWYKIF